MRGGEHGNGLGVWLDTQVRTSELGDVRELGIDVSRLQVGEVQQDVILVGTATATLTDLVGHGTGNDVTRCEVLDGGCVTLHEALTIGVTQDATLATSRLGHQNAQACQAGRVELDELHVLQRQTRTERDGHAVTGQGVSVGRGLEDLARAAGGEDHGLGLEHVQLAGGQVVGDHTGGATALGGVHHDQIEHVVLVVELHVVFDAVLVERLQNHVTGTVSGVARTADGVLTVVAGVTTETTLVDLALGRAVERQAHLLEVENRVNGLLGHDLGGVLIDQVVATLDGVERVPFPVVFFDVGQSRAHATLAAPVCDRVG